MLLNLPLSLIAHRFPRVFHHHAEHGQDGEWDVYLLGTMRRALWQSRKKRARNAWSGYGGSGLWERCCALSANEAQQDLQNIICFCHMCFEEMLVFVWNTNRGIGIDCPILQYGPYGWRLHQCRMNIVWNILTKKLTGSGSIINIFFSQPSAASPATQHIL